jgi:hypothetical protein
LEERKWKALLDALARRVNPLVARGHRLGLRGYYWTVRESEYATDIMFSDAAALQRVYPALLDHAIKRFSCADVLRFLGRRTVASRHAGEVSSNMVRRTEGVRVKHRVEENWLKMYDKQGSVLRIETVLNNVRRFKVWRMTTHQGVRRMRWIPMRKGLMDLERRVELSRAANERYLEALAVVQVPCPAKLLLDPVSNGVTKEGRPYRPLRPVSPQDAQVFQAVLQGQFLLRGFSNRDLRQSLNLPHPADAPDTRRHSARITRLLRLLRAHRLVRKVSHTRYYRVTPTGHSVMTAALALRDANLAELVA